MLLLLCSRCFDFFCVRVFCVCRSASDVLRPVVCVLLTVACACRAACEMLQTVAAWNATLPKERQHFSIIIGGIGVATGPCILEHTSGNMYGEAFDTAFLLG